MNVANFLKRLEDDFACLKKEKMNARKYLIKEHNGLFVLAISQQEQGYFVGTVIWYEKKPYTPLS